MFQRLKQFLRSLLMRIWPSRPEVLVVQQRLQAIQRPFEQPPAPLGNQRRNPAMEAIREIFSPRHAAETQIVFTTIHPNGVLVVDSEEWLQEGNALKTISRHARVITCSGGIESPENLKVRCSACGGFDSYIARCSHPQCGVALCRLHQKLFTLGNTSRVFCESHFLAATYSFNTWTHNDQLKKHSR